MKYLQSAPGFETTRVVDSFDWAAVKNGTVVDVGGSHGYVSIELARKFPSLRFIVQDQEKVIIEVSSMVPEDVADRVSFMAHDFFSEQPVKGADIYLFRWIFHCWSDKYCVEICRALIPALKPGALILVQEFLLPRPGTVSRHRERNMRSVYVPVLEMTSGFPANPRDFRRMDFGMMGMYNAKERDWDDWIEVFKEADPRFELKSVKAPPKSALAMITVEWKGDCKSL